MRIAVIGAGAMGSVFGGTLAQAGQDVVLIDKNRDHVNAIADTGLLIGAPGRDLRVRVPACVPPVDLPPFDVALITVDANNTGAAAAVAQEILDPDHGVALTLQNGIGNLECLTGVLGRDRVLAGVTHSSGAYLQPGHVAFTHNKESWLGPLDEAGSESAEKLAAAFEQAGHRITLVPNPEAWIWSKFVLNCAINPLAAATGLRSGDVARIAELDDLQDRILDEALAVVAARGITLPDPDIQRTVKATTLGKYNRPSMLQHIEAGRRTEIDALNGALVREAEALGIDAPCNRAVTAVIKGMERAEQRRREGGVDWDALDTSATAEAREKGLL